jgi:hypothetical protein
MALSASQQRFFERVTTAFIDLERGELPDPRSSGALARLAAMVQRLPRDQRRLLRAGQAVLDVLALARFARPFSRLDDRGARYLLRALARSPFPPLRRLHSVLKMMTQFAYFAGEATWTAIGYDGPWLGRIDVPSAPPPRLEERAS